MCSYPQCGKRIKPVQDFRGGRRKILTQKIIKGKLICEYYILLARIMGGHISHFLCNTILIYIPRAFYTALVASPSEEWVAKSCFKGIRNTLQAISHAASCILFHKNLTPFPLDSYFKGCESGSLFLHIWDFPGKWWNLITKGSCMEH